MREDYRAIAALVAEDIAAGRLRPGERLPPQRDFAYRRGIAASTASRVYAELARRGLTTGEIGRGTFVRAAPAPLHPALSEPVAAPVDLELNFPMLPQQATMLTPSLATLLRPDMLAEALRPIGASATEPARRTAAAFLVRAGFRPEPSAILFAGNGRQAIAAAFAALAAPGERIAVEPLTYPLVKGIAARLGIELVALAFDQEGLVPDSLARAHRAGRLHAVYLQPSLHNPLGTTMSGSRREELATLLEKLDVIAIEDAIYAFLAPEETPLAAFAPRHVIHIDSLSKRLAAGLTLGFLAAPAHLVDRVARAIRAGAWGASGFPLAAGLRWMADGTAERIAAAKREDAKARQRLARTTLDGLGLRGDYRAYHLLLELPERWRAEAFVALAARQGIAITPAGAFAAGAGHAPNAVRLALAPPPLSALRVALETLRGLALRDAEPTIE